MITAVYPPQRARAGAARSLGLAPRRFRPAHDRARGGHRRRRHHRVPVRQYQGALAMPVYTVDAGLLSLLSELRAIEKQAAEELGQWREKREPVGNGAEALTSITVQFVRPGEMRPSGGD